MLTTEDVASAIRKIAPSRICQLDSNGRKVELRFVGNWITTIKTVDKKAMLVSGSPVAYGQWIPHTDTLIPNWISICPALGGGVERASPNVRLLFEGTDEHLRGMVEYDVQRGQPGYTEWGAVPYTDLECAPMPPEVEASELDTAWRRTFRFDVVRALAEARAHDQQVVLYFRGPSCPDCQRVEQSTLSWSKIRGWFNGDWVVVESPPVAGKPTRDDPALDLRAKFHVTVLPTFVVYDTKSKKELARFDGYFSVEDFLGLPFSNGFGDGDCYFMHYLRP